MDDNFGEWVGGKGKEGGGREREEEGESEKEEKSIIFGLSPDLRRMALQIYHMTCNDVTHIT